jgi:hypothetical protein
LNEPARVKETCDPGSDPPRVTKKPAPSMAMSVWLADACSRPCFEISWLGAAETPPAE